MDPFEVGNVRFCWSCGRKAILGDVTPPLELDIEILANEYMECSCCKRPFMACPCTPAIEGECKSITEES